MSDALRVEDGCRPWLPAPHAEAGEVLDRFNVPRAGFLSANGLTYFFECILGDGGADGVWVYAHVTDEEIAQLLETEDPDAFDAVADALITNRWVTVAAATDDEIVESAIFDAGEEGAAGLVDRLMRYWDAKLQPREQLREMVGSARAAS